MRHGNYTYKIIDVNDLTLIEKDWYQLMRLVDKPAFIHDFRWYSSYIKSHQHGSNDIYFIELSHNFELAAIIPLEYVSEKHFGVNSNVWKIFWPNDLGINDFVINNNTNIDNLLDVLSYILITELNKKWDLLLLQNITDTALIKEHILDSEHTMTVAIYNHDSKHVVCGDNYDETTKNIKTKFKRNIRRKLKKLSALGEVTYMLTNSKPELDQAFESFIDVEAANWKGERQTSLKQNPKQLGFYKSLLDSFSQTNQCYIHNMYLNDRVIATQFAIVVGDKFNLLKIGYDQELQIYSPGGLLLNHTLDILSGDSKIKCVNFITGAKWNDDWSPEKSKVSHYYIYNKTITGIYCYCIQYIKDKLRSIKHNINL